MGQLLERACPRLVQGQPPPGPPGLERQLERIEDERFDQGARSGGVLEAGQSRRLRRELGTLGPARAQAPSCARWLARRLPVGVQPEHELGTLASTPPQSLPRALELLGLGRDALRKGGTQVQVGLFGGPMELDVGSFATAHKHLMGNFVGSLDEFTELMEFVRSGEKKDIPLETRPIGTVNEAIEDLRAGTIVGRCVLTHAPRVRSRSQGVETI